jgi:lysozyme
MIEVPRLAVEIAKKFEGCHREVRWQQGIGYEPYVCPAGFWTIGYGHLCEETHPPISGENAEQYLQADLVSSVNSALRLSPILHSGGEQRLSAVADFIFNLGAGRYQSSTLRRRVNEGNWPRAASESRKWVFGGGQKLPGLVARREVEAILLERE